MHSFLSNLANRQTDRKTDKHGQKHLPPPLSDVKTITSNSVPDKTDKRQCFSSFYSADRLRKCQWTINTTYLITFTVVLKATGTFTITAFAVLPRHCVPSTTFAYTQTTHRECFALNHLTKKTPPLNIVVDSSKHSRHYQWVIRCFCFCCDKCRRAVNSSAEMWLPITQSRWTLHTGNDSLTILTLQLFIIRISRLTVSRIYGQKVIRSRHATIKIETGNLVPTNVLQLGR